jgi:transcriptional regulator with XRE-family HTH domain
LCAASGKSVSGVASAIGLSNAAASGWKKGKLPNDTTMAKLAAYFGISVAELTAEEQTKKPATVSGDELDPVTRDIMDILSDLTPEELALAKARLLKIKESR